jgi:hypothetical protein
MRGKAEITRTRLIVAYWTQTGHERLRIGAVETDP